MTIAPDHAQVIAREERYLERKFGEDYRGLLPAHAPVAVIRSLSHRVEMSPQAASLRTPAQEPSPGHGRPPRRSPG